MKLGNIKRANEIASRIEKLEGKLEKLSNTKGKAGIERIEYDFVCVSESGHGSRISFERLLPKNVLVLLAVNQIKTELDSLRLELDSL